MIGMLYLAFFLLVPIGIIAFFAISLLRYIFARNANRKTPDTFSCDDIRSRKILLIASSVLLGVLVTLVAGIVALFSLAIAYM